MAPDIAPFAWHAVSPDPDGVVEASRWFAQALASEAIPADVAYALELCFEEAVSNAAYHGRAADLRVGWHREAEAFRFRIEDSGPAFDPTAAPGVAVAESIEKAQIGGLGIALMRRFSDRMDYERRADQNVLTITKRLPGPTS
jgi:anti-sigma regulatory factor (Ser/Thr protein kinase)